MATKNVIIYARVSSDFQNCDRQIEALTRVANENDWNIVKTFQEKLSGTIKTRPQLTAMLQYCKDNKSNIYSVIIDENSRLGRSVEIVLTAEELTKLGINLYTHKEHFNSLLPNGQEDQQAMMMLTFGAAMAKNELATMRHRQVEGKLSRALAGGINSGAFDVFGYKRSEHLKHKVLLINEENAALVQRIFNMYLRGNRGTAAIATLLNSEGIKPTRALLWSGVAVRNILVQPLYVGIRIYKGKLNAEPISISLPDLRIISDEDFAAAAVKLKDGSYKLDLGKRHEYFLDRKKITCGLCGKSYYALNNDSSNTHTYKCNSTRPSQVTCGNRGINIEKLDTAVRQNLARYFSSRTREELDSTYFGEQIEIKKNQIIDLKLEQENLKIQINNIGVRFEKAKISESEYEAKTNAVEAQVTMNQLKQTRLSADIHTLEFQQNEPVYNEITKEIIHRVIEKIIIEPCEVQTAIKGDKGVKVTMIVRGFEFKFILSQYTDMHEILTPLEYN